MIIGGSSEEAAPGTGRPDAGDFLYGDDDSDLIAGDNARFTAESPSRLTLGRTTLPRNISLLDLGPAPVAGTGGAARGTTRPSLARASPPIAGRLTLCAGIGDVRVWPWATPRGDFVPLALSSPDGNALFEVPRSVLVRFLRRTYVAGARGRETDHLDVDAALVRLLAGR